MKGIIVALVVLAFAAAVDPYEYEFTVLLPLSSEANWKEQLESSHP